MVVRNLKSVSRLLVAAALVLTARQASAYQINFMGTGLGAGGLTLTLNGGTIGSAGHGFAGELNWQWVQSGESIQVAGGGFAVTCVTSGTVTCGTPTGYNTAFYGYCADITDFLGDPQNVVNPTATTDSLTTASAVPNAGKKAAWLFNQYAAGIHALGGAMGSENAAALQIAIWDAMYDTVANLDTGAFQVTGETANVKTKALAYLAALYAPGGGNYNTSVASWLDAASTGTYAGQDQITGLPTPTSSLPTPEPGSLLLCGTGFIALARSLRRRRAAKADLTVSASV